MAILTLILIAMTNFFVFSICEEDLKRSYRESLDSSNRKDSTTIVLPIVSDVAFAINTIDSSLRDLHRLLQRMSRFSSTSPLYMRRVSFGSNSGDNSSLLEDRDSGITGVRSRAESEMGRAFLSLSDPKMLQSQIAIIHENRSICQAVCTTLLPEGVYDCHDLLWTAQLVC